MQGHDQASRISTCANPRLALPFVLLLIGLCWPLCTIAQDDSAVDAAASGSAAAAENAAEEDPYEQYQPPVPLDTTNVLTKCELYRESDAELAATVFTPCFDNLSGGQGFPALDLGGFIGHTSKLDPAFEKLALELASWQFPDDATDVASLQLLIIHSNCGDPAVEDMPEMSFMGGATSLMGEVYEVIILHPLNIPLAGAHVIPVEGGDSFGITLLMAGSLTSDALAWPEPEEADAESLSEEDAYFAILPEYQPPIELRTATAMDTYKVISDDGAQIARLAVPDWFELCITERLPALDLFELMKLAVLEDESFQNLGAALLDDDLPDDMASLPSWQLMVMHSLCGNSESEGLLPVMEHYGYSTFFFGDELDCVIVHPRNIPIAGALVYSGQGGRDFINLLTIIGELTYLYE